MSAKHIGEAIAGNLFPRLKELLGRDPTMDEVVFATVASVAGARGAVKFLLDHPQLLTVAALKDLQHQLETGVFVPVGKKRD